MRPKVRRLAVIAGASAVLGAGWGGTASAQPGAASAASSRSTGAVPVRADAPPPGASRSSSPTSRTA
jgi:hypothetical protein